MTVAMTVSVAAFAAIPTPTPTAGFEDTVPAAMPLAAPTKPPTELHAARVQIDRSKRERLSLRVIGSTLFRKEARGAGSVDGMGDLVRRE